MELNEKELDAVTGGVEFTQNRFNAVECKKNKYIYGSCTGFLSFVWCDHYRRTPTGYMARDMYNTLYQMYRHKCVMGIFNYTASESGHHIEHPQPPV